MSRAQLRVGLIVLAGLLTADVVVAQGEGWTKYHKVVEHDEDTFGEYTRIYSDLDTSPAVSRTLWEDSNGNRLVIRNNFSFSGATPDVISNVISVTDVGTSQAVLVDVQGDGIVTVTVGSGSFQFEDEEPIPQTTLNQAASVLQANTTQAFRDVLQELTTSGVQRAPDLRYVGITLQRLFFPEVAKTPTTHTSSRTAVVKDFDPDTTPPGMFEEAFGSAYYE